MPEELTAKNAAAHGPLNVSALQGLQGFQGASTS